MPYSIINPFYKNSSNLNDLAFDSIFETGNLAIALKVEENEYNLLL